jgi:hypothetical protein
LLVRRYSTLDSSGSSTSRVHVNDRKVSPMVTGFMVGVSAVRTARFFDREPQRPSFVRQRKLSLYVVDDCSSVNVCSFVDAGSSRGSYMCPPSSDSSNL